MTERAGRAQVKAWWGRWPDANVGVVTGAVSGVAVVDLDPRHGGEATLERLEEIWGGLPTTLESQSGGGGRHIWFTVTGAPVPSSVLGEGVELKAERGLIIAPPSRHILGGIYRWRRPPAEPVLLPDWMRQMAGNRGRGHRAPAGRPVRTHQEQREFRDLWLQSGVEIGPGDGYYLCPFHDDHHPSLHVDAGSCRWYCFACRIGGGTGSLARRLGQARQRQPLGRLRGWVGRDRSVTLGAEVSVGVVGESIHQDELIALAGGRRRYGGVELMTVAELVPLDTGGIEVRIEGSPVGFLDHEDAGRFAHEVDDAIHNDGVATCQASIRGGWDRGGDDVGLFGVTLMLPDDSIGRR